MKYALLFPNLTEEELLKKTMERDLLIWQPRMIEQIDGLISKYGNSLKDYYHKGWKEFMAYADEVDMPGICYLTVKRAIRNKLKEGI